MEHPAEEAELDAAYEPFPDLQVWFDGRYQPATWDVALRRLGEARAGADAPARRRAVETLLRAASIDTGAVEGLYAVDRGFTMSVARALTPSWIDSVERAKGADVRRMVEDQRAAFDLALDLATEEVPLSEAAVREVHAVVCASQATYQVQTSVGPQDRPLPRGTYKTDPNHVLEPDGTWHPYAPVEDVGHEMHRLVAATRSAAYRDAHPVVQAAYLHHGLTSIHPFPDGNGRVARVLASVPLLRAVSLPLVLYADEKPGYLDALAAADRGATGVLVTWFENQVLDAIEDVVESLVVRTDVADAAAELDAELATDAEGLGLVALRVLDEVERTVVRLTVDAAPEGVTVRAGHDGARGSLEPDPRRREWGSVHFSVRAQRAGITYQVFHWCALFEDEGASKDVLLSVATPSPMHLALPVPAPLLLRRASLESGFDQRLRQRLRRWAELEAEALLAGLAMVVRADGG